MSRPLGTTLSGPPGVVTTNDDAPLAQLRKVVIASLNPGYKHNGARASRPYRRGFLNTLRNYDLDCHNLIGLDQLQELDLAPGSLVLLLLNEDSVLRDQSDEAKRFIEFETYCALQGIQLIHTFSQSMRIASKKMTNAILRSHAVPVPQMQSGRAVGSVFSHGNVASHGEIELLSQGDAIPDGTFGAEYIDCTHSFDGRDYHVCIRLLCVGPHVNSAFLRARNTQDGNPSVHTRDTPPDPDLINDLTQRLVTPNRWRFSKLAQGVSNSLGFGFFALDVLAARDGQLLVCEVGYKLDDVLYRSWMAPLMDQHPNPELFDGTLPVRAAEIFARHFGLAV